MDTTDLDDAEKILTEYINSDSTSNSNILDETEAELLKFLAPSPARKKPRKKRFITYQYDCNGNRVYKEKNQSQTRRKKKKKEQGNFSGICENLNFQYLDISKCFFIFYCIGLNVF